MRRLTFLGWRDYANVMTNWTAAINAHAEGLEARCFTLLDHPFNYPLKRDWSSGSPDPSSLSRVNRRDPGLRRAIAWFDTTDVVVWAAEEGRHWPQRRKFNRLGFRVDFRDRNRRYLVFHSGSIYRRNASYWNRKDGPFALRLFGADNALLAGEDPRVRLVRICTPEIPVTPRTEDPLTVNHTPSGPERMGTELIREAVDRLTGQGLVFEYVQTSPPIPHEAVLDLLRRSHVHVDQVSPIGVMGMGALEAAAAGNVVLCTTHNMGLLRESLDSWPLIDPGLTVESVERALADVLRLPREELVQRMARTREWHSKNFSPSALARWWEATIDELSGTLAG